MKFENQGPNNAAVQKLVSFSKLLVPENSG